MSLNGLGAQVVQDAYNTSITETAGWFLVKYISRDTVELLATGKSGVAEAKTSLSEYQEKSPLYGLIMFRRKKVLIKYIPEGTSRLLQARTTVHFQDILERYAPYDTIVNITTPDGLNDTSLAAAFPLHTGSSAASNVKLDEITEDGEESLSPPRPQMPTHASSISSTATRRAALERSSAYKRSVPIVTAPPPTVYVTSHEDQHTISKEPFSDRSRQENATKPQATIKVEPSPIQERLPVEYDPLYFENSISTYQPSKLGQDGFKPLPYESFDYRPKVKLGPRPVNMAEKGRGSQNPSARKPVASLPAGVQAKIKPQSQTQPTSQTLEQPAKPRDSPMINDVPKIPSLPPPPPIPESIPWGFTSRPNSRGSSRSMPAKPKGTMTPEKQRLLKAVEMRKKQMRKSQPKEKTRDFATMQENERPDESTTHADMPHDQTARIKAQLAVKPEVFGNDTARKSDSGISMGTEYTDTEETVMNPPRSHHRKSTQQPEADKAAKSQHDSDERVENSVRNDGMDVAVPLVNSQEAKPMPACENPLENIRKNRQSRDRTLVLGPVSPSESPQTSAAPVTADDVPQISPAFTSMDVMDDSDNAKEPAEPSTPEPYEEIDEGRRWKRQGLVLQKAATDRTTAISDAGQDDESDDEFFAELTNATVHEARSMAVARSPATPVLTRTPSYRSYPSTHSVLTFTLGVEGPTTPSETTSTASPTTSSPLTRQLSPPVDETTPLAEQPPIVNRSLSDVPPMSPSLSQRTIQSASPNHSVQPGISKRIDTLADWDRRAPSPQPSMSTLSTTTSGNQNNAPMSRWARRIAMRSASESGSDNSTERVQSLATPPSSPQQQASHEPSPTVVSNNSTQAIYTVHQDGRKQRDSVSVTARIVRSDQDSPAHKAPADLHQSQLTINHHNRGPSTQMAPTKQQEENTRTLHSARQEEPTRILHSAVPREGAISPSLSRKSTEGKHMSWGRYRGHGSRMGSVSESTSGFLSVPQAGSPVAEEEVAPQKTNRASRFLKRMSGLGGSKKKSQLSPTPVSTRNYSQATLARTPHDDKERDVPPKVLIGDVNVQFPDTGLWKRRWVEIDEAGFIIFTVSNTRSELNPTRKFHLSEFVRVYKPAPDESELSYSVVMEFVHGNGTSLQIAAEDAQAVKHLGHLLQGYHQAWTYA